MGMLRPEREDEIEWLINYFNSCHDACMRKITFIKKRDVDVSEGTLIYPYNDPKEFIYTDIEIEFILNNYPNAKTNQIVLFEFRESQSFIFFQDDNFDYADIYELKFEKNNYSLLNFTFYCNEEKKDFLKISCKKFACKELNCGY